jgi:hypothetical protein
MSQLLLSSLAVVCPNCDGYNPPRTGACGQCGTGLFEAVPAKPAAPRSTSGTRPAAATGSRPALASSPQPGTAAPRAAEAVPPGMKPSARTPSPSSQGGIPTVEPAAKPGPPIPTVPPVAAARPAQAAPQTLPKAAPAARAPERAVPPIAPAISERSAPPVTDTPVARPGPPVPDAPVARPAPPIPDAPAPRPAAPAAAPAPAASPGTARPAPAASRFGLTVIAGTTKGQRYKLPVTGCVVGRSRGAILLQDDAFVSALHATFLVKDGALFIRDESSVSGVYVTIPGTEAIAPRTLFSAGSRLFRFSGRIEIPIAQPGQPVIYGAPVPLGQAIYVVEEVLLGGRSGRAVMSAAALLTIGQTHCDLGYPQDDSLATRHCELSPTPAGAMLRDLSGGLGTYVRIPPGTERPLRAGDRVRIGQHIFQIESLG